MAHRIERITETKEGRDKDFKKTKIEAKKNNAPQPPLNIRGGEKKETNE